MNRTRAVVAAVVAGVLVLLLAIISPMLMTSIPSIIGSGGELPDCTDDGAGVQEASDSAAADIPSEYLKLYKEHGEKLGVQWTILAAVGKRETDHGRSTLPGG
ncbi:hypothetical protein ACFSTC_05140 [Nonomuraea ferruginea]